MAHFLSEVTHERLMHRVEEHPDGGRPHVYIPGLIHTHDFYSVCRCICVLERTAEDERNGGSLTSVKVWSGDIDGSISIRHGLDGKPVHVIPQPHPNVYCFAIAQYKNTIWAGLSNGYLQIYDLQTRKQLYETKAHAGAINAFLVHGDIVYCASSDWTITQWDAITGRRISGGQFSGHQNAVRCLAVDNGLMYSGGDDSVIRCWDLASNTERTGTWPIVAHHDSVRAICVNDVYLFSSSTDGTINVWNTQSAQLVKQLEVCDASITTMAIDLGSNHIWAGSSDGLINIWDVSTLSLVGVVDDHESTNVALVQPVARMNAVKCWTMGADGVVRVWYSDTDPSSNEFEQLARLEAEMQQHVEDHRNRIIANYEELERCKAELILLEERDKRKKETLADTLGRLAHVAIKTKAFSYGMQWLDKDRRRRWNENHVSNFLQRQSDVALLQRYWSSWGVVARSRQDNTRKSNVSKHMAAYNSVCVARQYLLKTVKINNETAEERLRRQTALTLSRRTDRGILLAYFSKLMKFNRQGVMARKAISLSDAVANQNARSLINVYWQKLMVGHRRQRTCQLVIESMGSQQKMNQQNLMRYYYNKLLRYVRESKTRFAQCRAVMMLTRGNDSALMRTYFSKLASARSDRLAREAAARYYGQQNEACFLRNLIKDHQHLNADDLEQQLRRAEITLAVLEAGTQDLDQEIRALQRRNMQLKREYLKEEQIDIDKPALEQVEQGIFLLKAKSVSCHHHQAKIAAVRDECKKLTPEVVYINGLNVVKKICKKMVKPIPLMDEDGSPDWFVGDLFDRLKKKSTLAANEGIVAMCVAYDTMNKGQMKAWITTNAETGDEEWGPKHKHNGEFVANFGTLLEFSIRAFRYRRGEDPITGEPIIKAKKKAAGGGHKTPSAKTKKKLAKKKDEAKELKKKTKKKPAPKKAKKAAVASGAPKKKSPAKSTKKAGGKKKKAKKPRVEEGDDSVVVVAAEEPVVVTNGEEDNNTHLSTSPTDQTADINSAPSTQQASEQHEAHPSTTDDDATFVVHAAQDETEEELTTHPTADDMDAREDVQDEPMEKVAPTRTEPAAEGESASDAVAQQQESNGASVPPPTQEEVVTSTPPSAHQEEPKPANDDSVQDDDSVPPPPPVHQEPVDDDSVPPPPPPAEGDDQPLTHKNEL